MTGSSDREVNSQTENNWADKQLVERIIHGDSRAFRLVIQQTERLVTQIVSQLVDDTEGRKDLVQDIYLKAFKKLPGFRFEARLSTWIAQISYNTCLDYLRKKKREPVGALPEDFYEDNHTESQHPVHAWTSQIESQLAQKTLSVILKKVIDKLPPVYKTLIVLFHQEELKYDEIGQITGLPAGTIKNYLFRARKTLKDLLLSEYKKNDLW